MASENTPAQATGRRRTRGHGFLWFVLGLCLGVVGTVLAPRYAEPYLQALDVPMIPMMEGEPTTGTVVEKRRQSDRLLLRVESPDGVALATFTTDLDDIDLLVAEGDRIELGGGRYEPFLRDPAIHRVMSSGAAGAAAGGADAEAEPEREAYMRQKQRQLQQWDAEIAALEQRIAQSAGGGSPTARQALEEARGASREAHAALAALETADEAAWETRRADLDRTSMRLGALIDDVRAQLDSAAETLTPEPVVPDPVVPAPSAPEPLAPDAPSAEPTSAEPPV